MWRRKKEKKRVDEKKKKKRYGKNKIKNKKLKLRNATTIEKVSFFCVK